MNLDSMDERQATRLHYEVMGIALAILGHEGEGETYKELDEALSGPHWGKLGLIQRAFDMLPPERKRQILSNTDQDSEAVAGSIAKFKANFQMMSSREGRKTA